MAGIFGKARQGIRVAAFALGAIIVLQAVTIVSLGVAVSQVRSEIRLAAPEAPEFEDFGTTPAVAPVDLSEIEIELAAIREEVRQATREANEAAQAALGARSDIGFLSVRCSR